MYIPSLKIPDGTPTKNVLGNEFAPWKMDTLRFHFAFPSVAVFHWRKPWRVLDGLDLVGPCVSLSIGILQAETGIKCSTYLNCQLQAPQQIHA